MAEAFPTSPMRRGCGPKHWRKPDHLSNCCSDAPTITRSSPALASGMLPRTGASRYSPPRPITLFSKAMLSDGEMVPIWITVRSCKSGVGLLSRSTSRIAAPSASIRITHSAAKIASAADAAIATPADSNGSAFLPLRLKTTN